MVDPRRVKIEATEAADRKRGIRRVQKERVPVRAQELLPGIPNEISIDQIAPKMPWTAIHTLSSVSHGWRRAIRSRQIYDARVRAQSTQTFVVMNHQPVYDDEASEDDDEASEDLPDYGEDDQAIALHSLSDGACYRLPPIPRPSPGLLSPGLPVSSQFICLDGKLYVLGGYDQHSEDGIATVYVLDLAGQMRWEQCASMAEARGEFGCGVMNGKIYVFGGITELQVPVFGSEVYDPKLDAWSPIPPMKSSRFNHKVTAMGEELLVHNGEGYVPSDFSLGLPIADGYDRNSFYDDDAYYEYMENQLDPVVKPTLYAELYHPLKKQWRTVDDFTEKDSKEPVLTMGGKLHRLTPSGIDVYDSCSNSWEPSQSVSVAVSESSDFYSKELCAVVAVDNEFLGVYKGNRGTCLMRTKGVGCEHQEVVWQQTKCLLSLDDLEYDPFLCPVQL